MTTLTALRTAVVTVSLTVVATILANGSYWIAILIWVVGPIWLILYIGSIVLAVRGSRGKRDAFSITVLIALTAALALSLPDTWWPDRKNFGASPTLEWLRITQHFQVIWLPVLALVAVVALWRWRVPPWRDASPRAKWLGWAACSVGALGVPMLPAVMARSEERAGSPRAFVLYPMAVLSLYWMVAALRGPVPLFSRGLRWALTIESVIVIGLVLGRTAHLLPEPHERIGEHFWTSPLWPLFDVSELGYAFLALAAAWLGFVWLSWRGDQADALKLDECRRA